MTEPKMASGWPILSTILVLFAVAVMIGLGLWQLERKGEKEALIARHAANRALTSPVHFPMLPPVPDNLLYRRSTIVCLEPVQWTERAGQDRAGGSGFRMIADCRSGVEGPGILVDMGVSDGFDPPKWPGGVVAGVIIPGPDQPTITARLLGRAVPARAVLVADSPAPGLRPSAVPSPADVPNNHLAYAVQWFLFAGIAATIYILAMRRRLRGR